MMKHTIQVFYCVLKHTILSLLFADKDTTIFPKDNIPIPIPNPQPKTMLDEKSVILTQS